MNNAKRINKTIIYVNFSPYTNAGYFQDFLLHEYKKVIVFTFKFYSLGKSQESPNVSIFQNGKLSREIKLFQLHIPASLIFVLLPIRSFIFFIQLVSILLYLKPDYGPYHTFITVNALMAWIGNILKTFKLITKTIYWVWDYYPPINSNTSIQIMRGLYGWFDKSAINHASHVVFLNDALRTVHSVSTHNTHIIPSIGIGTKPQKVVNKKIDKKINLVFFGVIKKSEGLDLIFDALSTPLNIKGKITLHIIGSGPDILHFKHRKNILACNSIFYGYVQSDTMVAKLLNNAHIGLATYLPEESNVTQYTDPSKIKRYMSHGLPIITTAIVPIASQIESFKAGVITTGTKEHIQKAIKLILSSYSNYSKNAYTLSKEYHYEKLYRQIFNERTN